jgi:hypothetical protein
MFEMVFTESQVRDALTMWLVIFSIADNMGTYQLIKMATRNFGFAEAVKGERNFLLRWTIKTFGLKYALGFNMILAVTLNYYVAREAVIYLPAILFGYYLAIILYHMDEWRAIKKYEHMEKNVTAG